MLQPLAKRHRRFPPTMKRWSLRNRIFYRIRKLAQEMNLITYWKAQISHVLNDWSAHVHHGRKFSLEGKDLSQLSCARELTIRDHGWQNAH